MAVSAVAVTLVARPVAAQYARLTAGYAIAEYSEQSASFAFNGHGPSAAAEVGISRLALVGEFTRLQFAPTGQAASALASFTLSDVDLGLRYRVHPLVSLEAAVRRRYISPTGAAQELAAVRIGVRAEVPLAPGAMITARLGYLGAGNFSGGGSAPFGATLGLGFAYSPGPRRLSLIGDYKFERVDRHTTLTVPRSESVGVPIGMSVGRLGLAVRL